LEVLRGSIACGMPLRHNKSLFEARITPVTGGRMVLSVCVSHGLVDMQSFAQFMSDWSKLCRGIEIGSEVAQERNKLILPPEAADTFDMDTVEELGWINAPFLPWIASMGAEALVGESEPRMFNFSLSDVQQLKKLVQAGPAWATFQEKGYRLSAHDVITAIMWRALAEVHPYHPNEQWDLVVVVNWRGRTNVVTENYWGNATTSPHRSLPMQKVIEMDFSELALCVRELSTISVDALQQIIAYQNHLQYGQDHRGLGQFVNIGAPMISNGCGLYVSNFAKFDLYDTDFGMGRPEFVRMSQPPIPGMSFVYSQESGTDLTVVVTMSRKDSARLEGLDFEIGRARVRERPPMLIKPFCEHGLFDKVHDFSHKVTSAGRVARGKDEDAHYRFGDFTQGVIAKTLSTPRRSTTS